MSDTTVNLWITVAITIGVVAVILAFVWAGSEAGVRGHETVRACIEAGRTWIEESCL